ncbi:DUF6328 family protein [Yinghuangia seranimata]|uniref:DUF6328 family protein n=1 Tax=Yinghuangia seranimata TaxID=408067 RepID=UPI00248B4515|nr:DUF6328 family protein [Yinghuangia seranimata]MDI2125364.1 DUF6328 family protein [Yinghuangia seranimata]
MGGGQPERSGPRDERPDGRNETPDQRADRRWNETLQEVRVVQTGAQILFGFLLSVVFTQRFGTLGDVDRGLYVAAVVLGAASTGALVSIVACHVAVSGKRVKPRLVHTATWMVVLGIVLLACTVACSLLLLLRVAIDNTLAAIITGVVAFWLVVCWLVLPALMRARAE